jgi:hypothetical protein
MASDAALFVTGSLLLLVAHFARAMRWALLFPPDRVRRFSLLLGLAFGYAVNAIVPFRVGEILRALFVSGREGIRFAYVGATIVAERVADLAVVAAISVALAAGAGDVDWRVWLIGATMGATAAVAAATATLVRASRRARRLVWAVASIFNDRVRFGIADFFWSFSEMLAGGAVLRVQFLIATAVMWALYASSYTLFALAIGESLADTLYSLLGSPLRPLVERTLSGGTAAEGLSLLAFAALPVLGVIIYGFARQSSAIVRLLAATRHYGGLPVDKSLVRARDRFKAENEYEYFLVSLFSGDDQVVTGFGLRAVDDGIVHRLFNGGSDAVTALVEVDEQLVIRKFAVGAPAAKLKVQANWLASHRNSELSLVHVIGEREGAEFYRYDMPLVVPANDFYDVVHTSPMERSEALLADIMDRIAAFHDRTSTGDASPEAIKGYLSVKAAKNAAEILDFARTILPDTRYHINGTGYDLDDWRCLADMDWLLSQTRDRRTAVIHGDLTIENIIIAPERPVNWYIIDPNPENLFDSPLIDWAKLMQSLHLGYEGLNRGSPCSISESAISLSFTKSHAYSHLQACLGRRIEARFGADVLREIYFHELVNYLRLTPYKIRQNTLKGVTFFACTSILLKRYLERAV